MFVMTQIRKEVLHSMLMMVSSIGKDKIKDVGDGLSILKDKIKKKRNDTFYVDEGFFHRKK